MNDLYFQLVADVKHFRRMIDFAPGHVRKVQQAVNSAQVDKGAVLGDVLDLTFDLGADLEVGKQFAALGSHFLFQNFLAGQDDIASVFIQTDDLEGQFLADELIQIRDRFKGHLGTRQKSFDAQGFDDHAALDSAADKS